MYGFVRGQEPLAKQQMDLHGSCYARLCRSHRYGGVSERETELRSKSLQEDDWIRSPRFLESLNNRTRATCDVGATVSPNLCLITDTSERYPLKGATQRS